MTFQLPDFTGANILIVGDVMLDRYWHGPTSRISPEAPVPIVKVDTIEERPGGAANVAVNIAALGGHAEVLGIVGDDEAAQILQTKLTRLGIADGLLREPEQLTITKLRVLSRHQQLLRVDFENPFRFQSSTLLERFKARLPAADLVVVSDYGKGTVPNVQDYIVSARAANRPVLVDPKGRDFSIYRNATLITPNLPELEAVVGPCADEQVLVSKGMALLEELCLDALLVTRGEQGMSLLRRAAEPLHLAARAREVYDVTGAGDTVIATLAAGLASGLDLATAILLANAAAGIVVGKLGAAGVTASELQRALYEHAEPAKGSVSEEQLIMAVADAKQHGETVVMTNGCFDILHAGHVGYLEQARRLGNRLIVAVNDDASVRRLKGSERPVNKLQQRMQVLAGLAAVDWVVPFSEDTPERLICRVKPDYLVKGGDHAPDTIAGGRCVREAGGQVVVMDYFDGHSTSNIIARILDSS
ncbi:MAG: bifunctional D-glycero-beta-D-manno-heptose-7-phosphate kinase/D-glycero-beta-D-manno-heptose 1-phosphate adenylyltransferase HldE [Candidatus Competibacteraceae bacterium]|jgi:D-beta-D-heptose 7-phosphate kinase/D-beta-D-heptose 1-phosphate adenosyltransferase|nr:bifunctional D-glycero-beta-D-manno-heptose-7-phosphate kinase/D-glycero-beta-D-manno-heptose 1-phosphate adenylyltransferase HldE [Candidatus Competibacteraceae bacterium]